MTMLFVVIVVLTQLLNKGKTSARSVKRTEH